MLLISVKSSVMDKAIEMNVEILVFSKTIYINEIYT